MSLLVVTAVQAEADAVLSGLGADHSGIVVAPVGVGSAAAAAGTARLLALAEAGGRPYTGVVCAGIAGGFAPRAVPPATVLATRSIAADLGAESPDGFLPLDELGFGRTAVDVHKDLLTALRAALPDALAGEVLTVSTVTGTRRAGRAPPGRRGRGHGGVRGGLRRHGRGRAVRRASYDFQPDRAA
jgi:futalosine hydrolase